MADGDQDQQPPRYWFPYWSGPPPPVRPQLSRRLSPPQAPSHPRQPTAPATPPRAAQTQASSRPSPSPSRASPLAPIREPPNSNSNAGVTARPPPKPVALPATPKPKDVPQPEKTVVQHGHGKAAAGDKEHNKVVDKEKKDEHKTKDKDKKHHAGEESRHKEKEKKHHADAGEESKHKEKEKDKEKKHHADAGEEGKHKGKEKESKAEHGKLHGELKAGVADMVRRATGSGHGQGHPGASVITLAGENKGASMKVGGGTSKDGSWKEHHGGQRLDGGATDGKADGEKKQGMMRALINSNVQVINNSLLLQSSCSGGDPGVHLKLSAKSANKDKQKHAAGADKDAAAKK